MAVGSRRAGRPALDVCGVPADVFRISFTGEAGFELHAHVDDVAPL